MATDKAVAIAAANATREIDALAAALDQFGKATTGIGEQLKIFTDRFQDDFNNLFSDKRSIGQVKEINPFSNPQAMGRQQIQAGVEQVSLMGSFDPKKDPFKDLVGLIQGQKEIPFAVKAALSELEIESKGGQIGNEEVFDKVVEKLGDVGITLPDNALEALRFRITEQADRQKSDVFASAGLKELLKSTGSVVSDLVPMSEDARASLEKAFQASQEFRNSLLKIASLHQQMIEKERDMNLSILDKEASVRDRVNKALKRTPNIWKQAVGDMRDKLQTLTKPVAGTGVGGVGNVFDANQLIGQRQQLEAKAKQQRDILGLGAGAIFR